MEMTSTDSGDPALTMSEIAREVEAQSAARWGRERATRLIGRAPAFESALARVARFARSTGTVLVCGETGTGKELFARAVHVLSGRRSGPFVSVNCAQYQDGALSVSELFGHRRGSFTGAVADARGVFEAAEGGVLFLDEIGELPGAAQALVLRTLNDGEIVPMGEARGHRVDVRLVAATNRDLKALVAAGTFREDLYYRLRCLQVRVPALRERERDWELLVADALAGLNATAGTHTRFAPATLALLATYGWPGNVREVRALVETGFYECEGEVIEPRHVAATLEEAARGVQWQKVPLQAPEGEPPVRVGPGARNFWTTVAEPFLERDLNRTEVQGILAGVLAQSGGSYKRALDLLGIAPDDYLRFMDFLRHHRLKPDAFRRSRAASCRKTTSEMRRARSA